VEPKLVEGMAELLVLRAQLLSKSADLQKDCTEVQMGLARETYESLRAEMQQALDKVPVTPDKPGSPQ
jgi:hypothetical protein